MMYASTTIAASALVKTGATGLAAVVLTGGSDAATVTMYDNTTGSGAVLVVLKVAANATVVFCPAGRVSAVRGLYATISGTSPSVTVVYG